MTFNWLKCLTSDYVFNVQYSVSPVIYSSDPNLAKASRSLPTFVGTHMYPVIHFARNSLALLQRNSMDSHTFVPTWSIVEY